MSQIFWWMIFKLALCLEPSNTDKPLASDHLKCQALMGRSLMGVGCSRDKVTDWLFWMLCTCEKSILGKSLRIPTEKFLSLVLSRNAIHLIIQFLFNYLSSGGLQDVEKKRKFQIFISKSGYSCLQEVVASLCSKRFSAVREQRITGRSFLALATFSVQAKYQKSRSLVILCSQTLRKRLQRGLGSLLQEVSNWYFGKLVAEERWLQPEVQLCSQRQMP